MTRWAMVIDLAACTGCGACNVVCRTENNLPPPDERRYLAGRNLDWIQLATQADGKYEHLQVKQYPLLCQQCEHPPCIKVCPVAATYRDEEGIVGQIYARCIGCRYCTNACPYSAKTFNWLDPEWPKGTERRISPDVSLRPRGVVEKCTFCHHRRQKAKDRARAEGRELRPGDFVPACVEVCPSGAMHFGDLDDPSSEVSQLSRTRRAHHLLEDLGTEPKITYLGPGGKE